VFTPPYLNQEAPAYVQVNSGPIACTNYCNQAVSAGKKYWYVVTAEDSSGKSWFRGILDSECGRLSDRLARNAIEYSIDER
jgi:hypothetical protein